MPWQPTAVVYPDTVAWATGYLRDALSARPELYAAEVHVGHRVPVPRLDRMVIIRRDGGASADFRDNPRLAIRCWATTDEDALDLGRLVNALLLAAADGEPVLHVEHLSGPLWIEEQSEQPCTYSLLQLATRGTNLT